MEINLNRVFGPKPQPKLYEERLAQQLLALTGKPDLLLDLHTAHSVGPAFALRDIEHPVSDAVLKRLPVAWVVSGWPELYRSLGQINGGGDTISYMGKVGTTGICVKCGQHKDPLSAEVAYQTILATLSFFDMLVQPSSLKPSSARHIRFAQLARAKGGEKPQSTSARAPLRGNDIERGVSK